MPHTPYPILFAQYPMPNDQKIIPQWFIDQVKNHTPNSSGEYAAQLLWQRGIQDPKKLAGFLNPDQYQPTSPFEFGQEMKRAIQRLHQALNAQQQITIWGDFDADGITATSVLWSGLGQIFPQNQQLTYYIPNRFTESHGLNLPGIEQLAQSGTKLIITCDTGSTNLTEIDYAQKLGIDIIITDHHTLPDQRPPVIAIINPRYFAETHPLFHLSGVAVAYKLVEALYQTLPHIPQQPVEHLLDLVAIGLIADLVQLSGDCRYLAQKGIQQLQQQLQTRRRPGVARLLDLCQRSGDRPTDISFGLGPRINAVSRIQGDATFCVELLTSRDQKRCHQLAEATELANSRRKSLQKDLTQEVKTKLAQIDLSTTSVIVLEDPQWQLGVLGLVAGQIAQEYGRPTILLSTEAAAETATKDPRTSTSQLARGSARSVNNIDLYELVKSQAHLLHKFGGHPLAAGLSIPIENIPLFSQAINQQLRQKLVTTNAAVQLSQQVDLVVNVASLSKELFQELKIIEPCGMGNPVPRLLIKNCWFEQVWNSNTQDIKGGKVQYIKTELEIWDDSSSYGFPGLWWGHYKDEVPKGKCHAIVELDYNNYKKRAEARLISVQLGDNIPALNIPYQSDWILDWRGEEHQQKLSLENQLPLTIRQCPTSWDELQSWFRRALQAKRKLAIAYAPPEQLAPQQIWEKLLGIAKYLIRTSQAANLTQIQEKLQLSDRTLQLGISALSQLGFQIQHRDWSIKITLSATTPSDPHHPAATQAIQTFLAAIAEEQFLKQYFYHVPQTTIKEMAAQTLQSKGLRDIV